MIRVDTTRARASIFARLREAYEELPLQAPDIGAFYAAEPAPDPASRLTRFIERARGWQAEVHETCSERWTQTLAGLLAEKGVKHLLAGPDTSLSTALQHANLPTTLSWYDTSIDTYKDTLFTDIDAGITTTRGGIAETGSLLVWPTRNEPRTLSLVPPIHFAVVHADAIFNSLHAAIDAQAWAADMPTNALLVTGPSKTADIQRLLVYGAHGPKQLVILVVHAGEPT